MLCNFHGNKFNFIFCENILKISISNLVKSGSAEQAGLGLVISITCPQGSITPDQNRVGESWELAADNQPSLSLRVAGAADNASLTATVLSSCAV